MKLNSSKRKHTSNEAVQSNIVGQHLKENILYEVVKHPNKVVSEITDFKKILS